MYETLFPPPPTWLCCGLEEWVREWIELAKSSLLFLATTLFFVFSFSFSFFSFSPRWNWSIYLCWQVTIEQITRLPLELRLPTCLFFLLRLSSSSSSSSTFLPLISARHWPTTYSSEAMSENLSLFSLPLASHFIGAVFSCGCNLTPTVLVLELVVVVEMRNSSREQRTVSTFADIRESFFSVFHYSQSYSVDHLDSVCL